MIKKTLTLNLPLDIETKKKLKAGQYILLSGIIYTMRDLAHKLLLANIKKNEMLPFNLKDATIFYAGPTSIKGNILPKAIGPTTSSRMDKMTIPLLENKINCIIGKGKRSKAIEQSMLNHKCIYFAGVGGCGALLAQSVKKMDLIAYSELGPEAIYRLSIKEMPLYVAFDLQGNSIYK